MDKFEEKTNITFKEVFADLKQKLKETRGEVCEHRRLDELEDEYAAHAIKFFLVGSVLEQLDDEIKKLKTEIEELKKTKFFFLK